MAIKTKPNSYEADIHELSLIVIGIGESKARSLGIVGEFHPRAIPTDKPYSETI